MQHEWTTQRSFLLFPECITMVTQDNIATIARWYSISAHILFCYLLRIRWETYVNGNDLYDVKVMCKTVCARNSQRLRRVETLFSNYKNASQSRLQNQCQDWSFSSVGLTWIFWWTFQHPKIHVIITCKLAWFCSFTKTGAHLTFTALNWRLIVAPVNSVTCLGVNI